MSALYPKNGEGFCDTIGGVQEASRDICRGGGPGCNVESIEEIRSQQPFPQFANNCARFQQIPVPPNEMENLVLHVRGQDGEAERCAGN